MLTARQLARPGLAPIDLDLADGACVAVTGPSGGGKTLFMRAIADLDPAGGTGIGVLAAVLGGAWRITDSRHRLRLDRLAAPKG